MAYDEALAERARRSLAGMVDLEEKKMFGGIAFLVHGAMCIGVHGRDLIVRCEKEETDTLLGKKGVRVFDLSGGRPMKGWLLVGAEATASAAGLRNWVSFAVEWTKKNEKPASKKRVGTKGGPRKRTAKR